MLRAGWANSLRNMPRTVSDLGMSQSLQKRDSDRASNRNQTFASFGLLNNPVESKSLYELAAQKLKESTVRIIVHFM